MQGRTLQQGADKPPQHPSFPLLALLGLHLSKYLSNFQVLAPAAITPQMGWLKQQKLITYSSGGLAAGPKRRTVLAWPGSEEESSISCLCPTSLWREGGRFSGVSSYEDANPLARASPS